MRRCEDKLWGNASSPGLVDLRIDQANVTLGDIQVDGLGAVGTGLRYGAFAAMNLTQLRGGPATITLSVRRSGNDAEDDLRVEVVTRTLNAFLLLGGVGGRTRRGFGALSPTDAETPGVTAYLEQFLTPAAGTLLLPLVPTLHGATYRLSRRSWPVPVEAHKAAVGALRDFRQGPDIGRNPGGGGHPGRSRWPEPDEIRRSVGPYPAAHAPVHPVRAFPRAAFGMPIVFHFMGAGEPPNPQLLPDHGNRMASPLLLRPVRDGTVWRALALRLQVPGLGLTRGRLVAGNNTTPVRLDLTAREASLVAPLATHGGGQSDPVAAFLEFFSTRLA